MQYLFQLFNEWVWNPFVFDTQWNTQIIVDQYYVQNANCISINAKNPIEYMNRSCAWLKMQSFTPPQLHHVAELNNEKKLGEMKKIVDFFLFNHWFDFSTKADIMMLPTKTIKSTITIHQKKTHENRIKCSECKPFNFHSLLLNERVSMNLSSILAFQYQHFCCAPFRCKAHSFTWIGCETTANRLLFIGKVFFSSSTRGFLVRCKIFVRCWTSLKWIHLHGFNISIWMHQIT